MPNFQASHALVQSYLNRQLLAGASAVVMQGDRQLDAFCLGYSDVKTGELLQTNQIHRAFSNTKLITSALTLMFMDEGHFALDDPIKNWIPEFGNVSVLRPGAESADDTVNLETDISIRHLLSHTSGLSHGVFDPGTVIFNAYTAAGVRSAQLTLAQVMPKLAALPLSFQPGQGWDYAIGADLLARLMEIITGKNYADILQARIFDPLGMVDTGYGVSPANHARLAPLYRGEDPLQPMLPGLHLTDNLPWPDAFVKPVPRQAGTGGLVTTQADYLRFMQALFGTGSGSKLLKANTLKDMLRDQVPAQFSVHFAHLGTLAHLGFGLGGAVTRATSALQPNSPVGEFQWGGLAGTHWSFCPSNGVMIVQMAQRHFGFWHPFWFQYKAAVYQALL